MKHKIILSDIKQTKKIYKWNELNCFYRVFAILFGSKMELREMAIYLLMEIIVFLNIIRMN